MTKHRAAKHAARAAAQTSGRKYPEARRADVGPADPSRREPPGDYNLPPTNCPECNGQREWTGEGSRAACHFCGASALTLQHAVVYGEGGHVYPGRPADGGNACPRCGSGDTYPGPFVRRCNTCGEAAECEDGAVWTAFEDERGYLYEVPDDDGRIRVRDLDGDTVSWYDPGDEGYDTLIRRMRAETLFEHLVHLHSTEDAAEKSPAEALAYHSWDHDTGVSGEEHEHPHDLVWPMALAPVPEVVWAEDVAGLGLGFTLSGGGYGNPGCDECGMADAVVRIDGTHLCESSLEEASWRTLLDRWRTAHAGERCDECEAVCGDYDGVSFTHEEHCSLHPRNAASGDTNRGGLAGKQRVPALRSREHGRQHHHLPARRGRIHRS